jgi:hypothetical protein
MRAVSVFHIFILKKVFEFSLVQDSEANYVKKTIEEGQGTVFPQGSVDYRTSM